MLNQNSIETPPATPSKISYSMLVVGVLVVVLLIAGGIYMWYSLQAPIQQLAENQKILSDKLDKLTYEASQAVVAEEQAEVVPEIKNNAYIDANLGFSFQYPKNWKMTKNSYSTEGGLWLQLEDSSVPAVNPFSKNLSLIVLVDNPGIGFEYLSEIQSEADITVDGVSAKRNLFSGTYDGNKLEAYSLKFTKDGHVYMFLYQVDASKWDSYKNLFNQMVETIKFID
ncbi:MAG TPA: PsbP-related protein [Candidatus Bipolaricaulota bacterium]|nr:PsbP-related protein [Candidatus Bipolaricaulota bacterium]